jgi:hypothetical protein
MFQTNATDSLSNFKQPLVLDPKVLVFFARFKKSRDVG